MKKSLSLSITLLTAFQMNGQIKAKFSCPDTVFTNQEFNITNLSTGATNCLWRFCKGEGIDRPVCLQENHISNQL